LIPTAQRNSQSFLPDAVPRLSATSNWRSLIWIPALLFVLSGCGVPNLEPPECSAARTAVREFYSFHFGNEMKFSLEGLDRRKHFLSPSLIEQVGNSPEGTDPFTTGDADLPKAFRAGECRVVAQGRTQFDLLIFWKDDVRTEQRTLKVEAVKTENGWLVDKIER